MEGEPVVSRAILNRLKAPSELALAQRLLARVAASAEPAGVAAALAYCRKPSAGRNANPAREAFLQAAALSVPGAKYAGEGSRRRSEAAAWLLPGSRQAATARAIRDLRCDFKRFSHFYLDGSLLPLSVFLAAVELPPSIRLQQQTYRYTGELVALRNELVKEYLRIKRALRLQPRGGRPADASREKSMRNAQQQRVTLADLAAWEAKLCQESELLTKWKEFELRWLQENEGHAVLALQPLVAAVSAAEAILKSCRKQQIFPEPSATLQRQCTFRAVEAFCSRVTALAAALLSVEFSCLLLEAHTIVLAAALEAHASKPPTGGSPAADALRGEGGRRSEGPIQATQGPSSEHRGCSGEKTSDDEWAVLCLSGLAGVANVDEEDVVVYSAKRRVLAAARSLVASFLSLLQEVWEARLCLSHMGPDLRSSRPSLVSALLAFDRAHAAFQLPPTSGQLGGPPQPAGPQAPGLAARCRWQKAVVSA
ncbi:hypothetical protein Efla_005319 [Eimeria flavescens]